MPCEQPQSAHSRFRPGHAYGAGYDSPLLGVPFLGRATLFRTLLIPLTSHVSRPVIGAPSCVSI